jgi:DNA polymerase-3 subunit delta
MKIAAGWADGFCRKPQDGIAAVLVYGPDRGLVQERGESLARAVVDDLRDPFRVSDLMGKAIAGDGALLADEAAAQALTGGRRVVRVRDAGNDAADAVAAWLDAVTGDSLVVLEAGELAPSSRLRKLFESADNAAAVACYADDASSLQDVIDDSLGQYGLRATPGARDALLARLGSDRKLSRREIDKLALYVGDGATEVDEAAVEAVVGDSASVTLDDLADAVAGGDHAGVGRSLARLHLDGVHPVGVLRAVQRHFLRLHLVAASPDPDGALSRLRPPLFFKRKPAFMAQLRRWPAATLAAALELLLQAEIDCKTTGLPAEAVCGQVLTRLTAAANR